MRNYKMALLSIQVAVFGHVRELASVFYRGAEPLPGGLIAHAFDPGRWGRSY